jgi:hypothetical protein
MSEAQVRSRELYREIVGTLQPVVLRGREGEYTVFPEAGGAYPPGYGSIFGSRRLCVMGRYEDLPEADRSLAVALFIASGQEDALLAQRTARFPNEYAACRAVVDPLNQLGATPAQILEEWSRHFPGLHGLGLELRPGRVPWWRPTPRDEWLLVTVLLFVVYMIGRVQQLLTLPFWAGAAVSMAVGFTLPLTARWVVRRIHEQAAHV